MPSQLIDCDVHEDLKSSEDVRQYLSEGWREFASSEFVALAAGEKSFGQNPWGYHRKDSLPPDGGPPGSSPELMIEQLVDPLNLHSAILTGDAMGIVISGLSNPYLADEVARASNMARAERWLSVDPRFKGSISLALHVPAWAAKEVRRLGGDERFVQACVGANPLPYPFGHPIYDPVHRACAETGKAFAIHSLGNGSAGSAVSHLGGGTPTFYLEFHSGAVQEMMTHTMSFILHGVFERYPDLKLVLLEAGAAWVPAFLARLDANFKGLRREVPWCKRLPSEYFRDHVRVGSQPHDHDRADDTLLAALDAIGAEDFLLFATDYPHWDADTPTTALQAMPRHWREKVALTNAAQLYSLPLPVAA